MIAIPAQVITLDCRQPFPVKGSDGQVLAPTTRSVPFHYACRGMVLVDPNNKYELESCFRLICGRASVYNDRPRFAK